MILVDTSVIVSYWRTPTASLRAVFTGNEMAICGVSVAELMHGARNEFDLNRIKNALHVFHHIEISDTVWITLGKNLNGVRQKGITVPFQDALIATVAIINNLELWSFDKHFDLIRSAIPALKKFELQNIN